MLRFTRSLSLCLLVAATTTLNAESKNPSDYPLRVHIYGESQTTFYHNRNIDESKGEGRANLFENGEARGFDFSYECLAKLKPSFGYETYPAKWKKPNEELVVLLPVFGKSNAYFTCNLKTAVKDYAYIIQNGRMDSEPTPQFKAWMTKHDYDPEHGKNMPTKQEPQTAAQARPPASQQ
jgi:hypothetical protein